MKLYYLKYNTNSYIYQNILAGTLFSDSSRIDIYKEIVDKICQRPIFGWGMCGEHRFNIIYSHNLYLELIFDFGILGFYFSVLISWLLGKYYLGNTFIDYSRKCLIAVFFIVGFVQLMLSRTYISESSLFILLALVFNEKERLINGD